MIWKSKLPATELGWSKEMDGKYIYIFEENLIYIYQKKIKFIEEWE